MTDLATVDKLAELLGGWPGYFGETELQHGRSILAQLRRDRLVDEPVFGIACRYAVHRAAYDRVSARIKEAEVDTDAGPADDKNYLSGDEQTRAYHFNKLATVERELVATPYQRLKAGQSAQTTFMDVLIEAPKEVGGNNSVTPFRPLSRQT
ncbi:MAG: hypothetical protein QNJ44_22730 [Rhodobacter sp.]|nr:hypothetical protein [Rhodobacter sp.]